MSETEPNDRVEPSSADDTPTVAWTPPRDDVTALPQPVTPATPEPAPARRSSRFRWFVAGLVTVLVVGVTAAATLLVTGQSPGSSLVGYVDNSSIVYAEARLDLPGDQRQKLDEALDRLVDKSSQGKQNWSTKIKPWFGGEIAMGAAPPQTANAGDIPEFHGLAAIKVRDGAAAMAWLKDLLTGTTVASQSYNGTELLLLGSSGQKGAAAVADGKALLIGDEASVRKAIDSHGNGTFAQSDGYKQARAALTHDQLGFLVIDTRAAYMDVIGNLTQGMPGAMAMPDALKALVPPWMAMSFRAEADALVLDVVIPHLAAIDVGDNRPSEILPHLPATTIFVADGRDVAAGWKKALDLYRQMPGFDEVVRQLDTALNMVGGFDKAIGWIHDGAIVVTRNGSTVDGGLVFTPSDVAAAQGLFASVRNALAFGGAQAGITIADESYNGATITTIDVGNIQDLLNAAGAGRFVGPSVPDGRLKIAYVVTDKLVAIGIGDAFIKSALDTQPGASLASDSRFKAATDRAGASNRGLTYIDITAARELIENLVPVAERAEYERDYKPYLLPLKAFVVSNREDGSVDRAGEWLIVGK